MSVTVEDQIRQMGRAFEQYVDDIGVDEVLNTTSSEPVRVMRNEPSGLVGSVVDSRDRSARRFRRRPVLVAAALMLVAGAAGIWVSGQRATDSPASPTASAPTASEPAAPWYRALAPLLPDGFEHVAILQSHEEYVVFEAFNPASSKTLNFTVTRSAMQPDTSGVTMTLAEAQADPWTDPGLEYDVSLPDGRQIGVICSFRPMPATESGCPDLNGDRTDPETLRAFALALATDLSPDELPPPAEELDRVSVSTIIAAIGDLPRVSEMAEQEAEHYAYSFVHHGFPDIRDRDTTDPEDYLTVRTVTGFHPPLPADLGRISVTHNGARLTWEPIGSRTMWSVFDSPNAGSDFAPEILDRAVNAPAELRPVNELEIDSNE